MLPNIGDLNRLIQIKRNTPGAKNAIGEQIPVWVQLAQVWAQYVPVSDGEKMLATEQFASIEARFVIRWYAGISDLNAKDQITMDGRDWNILGVKEIARRQWFEITAGARDD